MIILDTNLISEVMKPSANADVVGWLNEQAIETLYLSSVTVAELLFGIGNLPTGKRKHVLNTALEQLLALFNSRILTFDEAAARSYAQVALRARAAGKGISVADGYIAAMAAANSFIVATRDTAPFYAAGVEVINPWHLH
jgi:toxin FitB